MVNPQKVIVCLHAGVIAVSAAIAEFNGYETIAGYECLYFDISSDQDTIKIDKVSVDKDEWVTYRDDYYEQQKEKNEEDDDADSEEEGTPDKIVLTIPGDVNGKQVCIQKEAFSGLYLNYLQLELIFFKRKDESAKPIKFPEDCSNMFKGSESITKIDLTGVDSSKVANTKSMFEGCYDLKNITFKKFNTSKVTDMSNMFCNCWKLEKLHINPNFG